jgi:ADP-ribosylation factor GTPase-activating protein 1
VHVSFVRSITMDAFKQAELARMSAGGNNPWKQFWESHEHNTLEGRTWDESTIRERYEGDVGEEWKARLTAKVEGREYVPGEEKKNLGTKKLPDVAGSSSMGGSRSATPTSFSSRAPASTVNPLRKTTSNSSRSSSPAIGTASLARKTQNESFFAKKGNENAGRSDDLPPSQGGKFTGFGSDPWPVEKKQEGIPGADEFQKDPIAALTKGFGWFGGVVQKGVGDGLQKVCIVSIVYLT